MSEKRQRAIAKRLKRKPTRDRLKARKRSEHNKVVRANRRGESDLMAPLAISLLAGMATKNRRH